MELTGFDYVYVTNIEPSQVEASFLARIKEMWPSPLIDDSGWDGRGRTKDEVAIFFERDEAMGRFQEENGYALNEKGEGCFMFCAMRYDVCEYDTVINKIERPRERANTSPYPAKLLLRATWIYTLVLPASIDESPFARRIHEFLMEALSTAAP